MKNTTLGVFNNHTAAESTLNKLKAFGVSETDLSYVYKSNDGDLKDEQSGNKVGENAAIGAGTGAVLGGIAGLIVANIVLPGFGTLFVAGPLGVALGISGSVATAAAGAATGAAAGGLIGALQNLGVDEADTSLYEDHVRKGGILIVARNTQTSTKDIFMKEGATEVREYIIN
jgi:uncharacterized membrane protein